MWFGRIFRLQNLKYWKKLVDKLIEECSENIRVNKMIYNEILREKVCYSCTIFVLLLIILLIISKSKALIVHCFVFVGT